MGLGTLLAWVGVGTLIALCGTGVSLLLHRRSGSYVDLTQRVHAVENDLNELFDRVAHWQRRDRTRRLREAPDLVVPEQPEPARGTPEYKTLLRQKAINRQARPS